MLLYALILTVAAEPERPAEFAWFAEGEDCVRHQWSAVVRDNPDYAGCYGSAMLVLARDDDPPPEGWTASFDIEAPEDGAYLLWLAATPPGAGSPMQVGVDGQAPVPVGPAGQGSWGPGGCFRWLSCARVGLSAGRHEITIGCLARRRHDNRYYDYLDALGLERVGDDASLPLEVYPPDVAIGKLPIRAYSGNGSVGLFMQYWGTQTGGDTGAVNDDLIALLDRCGQEAYCDYLSWATIERERGEWDWSFYRANADRLAEAGIGYNVFCWLHFPPKWAEEGRDFTPYRCLEHGETLRQSSLWSPLTLATYEDFYRRLAEALGDRIPFLRLAVPSEYGELGLPVGMTNWLVPQEHVHGGYWCGDEYALADFRERARQRFGDLATLRERWGVGWTEWSEVAPPASDIARAAAESGDPATVRRWLDFVEWYQDSVIDFAETAAQTAHRELPGREVIASLGYGQEPVPWGNDESRFIKRFVAADLAAQTPGDIGYFATRRVSTACRAYGVRYYTEPPGSVDRAHQVRRIFMDASNGTQTWFDYPPNLDGARDLLRQYGVHLTGKPPVCDVGFVLPSSWWWLRPEWSWPKRTEALAEFCRDRFDWEVLDELLLRDGAAERLGLRMLVLAEGDLLRADTIAALARWVDSGGVLVTIGRADLHDLDGAREAASALLPPSAASAADAATCWSEGRAVGLGRVLSLPERDDTALRETLSRLVYDMSTLDPARRDAPRIDDDADGVQATLLPDRILYYNTQRRLVRKRVVLDPGAFSGARPSKAEWELSIPAGAIGAIVFE